MSTQPQITFPDITTLDTDNRQSMLSLIALELLQMHEKLSDVAEHDPSRANDYTAYKQRLDELSYVVVMDYKKRMQDEKVLKSMLLMMIEKMSYFQNSLQETGRLLVQEMRSLREDVHAIAYDYKEKKQYVSLDEAKVSNIDTLIKKLKNAQANMISENPHLFAHE